MEFFTIGVYNSTDVDFFNKLIENQIDTFCDIRQRRIVRGAKYAFVNSNRLQKKLDELNIKYLHILELAPTKKIRELQKQADLQKNELKRERRQLGEVFRYEYKRQILDVFDFETFIQKLKNIGANKIVLFCVEEYPEACHRSIVAEFLMNKYGYKVTNL